MTVTPRHSAPDLFMSMKNTHQQVAEVFSPVYVFGGVAPDIKSECREGRQDKRDDAGKEWRDLRERALKLHADVPPLRG